MHPGYVKTIREEIFFEYARLISRTALKGNIDYPFVSNRFKALLSGKITMAGTNREWQQAQEQPITCVFCGSPEDLDIDHLIPRMRGGSNAPDNSVLSCRSCREARGRKGIFQWLGPEKKDLLPPLVTGKYLKELFELHAQRGTLEIHKHAITLLCPHCSNIDTCREWDVVEELTCFCLESVF